MKRCSPQVMFLCLTLAVPATLSASPLSLLGHAGLFYNRGYLNLYGVTTSMLGEELAFTLSSSLLEERFIQYTISNSFVNGNTLGDSDPLHLLEESFNIGFNFLPYHSYSLSSWGGVFLQKVTDGPQRSSHSKTLNWGSQLSLQDKTIALPRVIISWNDYYNMAEDYFGVYRERRKQLNMFSYYDLADTRLEMTYNLYDDNDLESRSGRLSQVFVADSYTTFATRTTLYLEARGAWNDNLYSSGRRVFNRNIGLKSSLLYTINQQQEVVANYNFGESKGFRAYTLTSNLGGEWRYLYTRFWRILGGGEFAHEATDGVTKGFIFQKGTEALLAGSEGYFGGSGWRFEPIYRYNIGAIQVQDGKGGLYLAHNLSLPLEINYIEQLPTTISFYLLSDSDSSGFPRETVTRGGFFRTETRELGNIGINNRLYVESYFNRSDMRQGIGDMPWQRSEYWEVAGGGWIRVAAWRSRLGTRVSNRWNWNNNNEYDRVINTSVVLSSQPIRPLNVENSFEMVRYKYAGGGDFTRFRYELEVQYRVRAIEFVGNLRYDNLPYTERDGPWQLYLRLRRSFRLWRRR